MEGHDKKNKVATKEVHVQTEQKIGKNVHVQTEQTAITLDGEQTNDRLHAMSKGVEIKSDSPHKFDELHLNLNEEETLDQKQAKYSDNALDGSMTKYRRVVETSTEEQILTTTNIINAIGADLAPVTGYAEERLLPLSKACAPLPNIIDDLSG
ncbi:unnamed protein product, partial [Didymodactylos carnosus]